MASNKYWVEKADLKVQDIITEGGYLNAEQTQELFELEIKESVLLQLGTFKPMSSSEFEIPKMGFTGRVLRAAQEGVGLSESERVRPALGQTKLSVKEFIAEARIPYSALEDHVIDGTLLDEVRRLLSKAIARDIEWIGINGDTAGPQTTPDEIALAQIDGFIKQAVTNVVNAGGVRLAKSVLKQMAQTMPSEYFRQRRDLMYASSKNAVIDYGDSLASRATALGDNTLMTRSDLEYSGMAVMDIPEFPENLGGGNDETVVLLTTPPNMWVGQQRQVLMETDKDISARDWIVVATIKFDVKYAHEPAVTKATGVLADAGP